MYYKIASILLNNEQKAGFAGDVFIAQPDTNKEALVGKLFILAEIQTPGSEGMKILNFLINNINFNYYQNEKVILRERIETISLENIFESALAKTNKDLVEFLSREKIKINPYAFNAVICVLYKNEIYFSSVGKNKIFLIYKEKTAVKQKGREEEPELEKIEYKISDINSVPDAEALNINKLFSNVVNGKIPVGGYFLIINEALSEYISPKQLIRIVTKLSPAGAAEQIQNLLEQINSYVSFLGIIIKNTLSTSFSSEELKKKLEEEMKFEDYRPEIIVTEKKTEEIMTPSGIVNLKKLSKTFGEKIKKSETAAMPIKNKTIGKMFLLKEKIFFKKRGGFLSFSQLKAIGKKVGGLLGLLPAAAAKLFGKNNDDQLELTAEMKTAIPDESGKKPFWTGGKIKLILAAALIFIVVFAVNLYITDKKNKAEEKQRVFNALIASIEKNQNKIEADFLYGNKAEAKNLLEENKGLLAEIPQEEIAKREMVRALFDKQNEQLEKARGVNKIKGLEKIADFSKLTAAANPENLLFTDGKIYAADAPNKTVFKIDTKENIVTAVYNLNEVDSLLKPTAASDGDIYYFSPQNIWQLDKEEKIAALKISLPNPPDNIGGFQSYSDKVYLLDKKDSQIYRYTRSGGGFVNQTKWLNEKVDFSTATNIFIDGNIYVLYQDGRVEKYLKGKKEKFSLDVVDPPLENAARFIATDDNFFIFEPTKKRLVIFDNKGVFLAQDIFEDFSFIKDFEVNAADKKIYILAGAEVYEMELK